MRAPFPALALALGLAGCAAPQDCDPTRTTFLTGIGCAAGGGYTARQDMLAGEQRAAVDRMADARADSSAAAARERDANAQLAAARQRVAQQDRQIQQLRQQFERAQRDYGAADARVRQRLVLADGDVREPAWSPYRSAR